MYDYIMSEVAQIRDPQLKTVCTVLMERNREKLMYYPAASKNHHALMSGLLFHMKRMLAMGKRHAKYIKTSTRTGWSQAS